MPVKRYNGSNWEVISGVGLQGPAGNDGTAPLSTKGQLLTRTASAVTALGVGSNDQVLTADSAEATGLKWATPSSGGMTLLSTTSLSGSSVTISSINQTYKHLKIIITGAYGSASGDFRLRLNANSTAGNYLYHWVRVNGSGTVSGGADAADNSFLGGVGTSNSWDAVLNLNLDIYRYAETESKAIFWTSASQYSGGGFYFSGFTKFLPTTAISELTVYPASGTFSGGTVYIYGVK